MIRMENNRIDKLLSGKYFSEIESALKASEGIDDLAEYAAGFEKEFSGYVGSGYAYAVNSGTDALQLALLALGIGKGDEVIVPDLTYVSTALAVKYTGAKPVFADVRAGDLTMDEADAERKMTPRTKAIIPVHMFGHPCNLPAISAIAKEHSISVVEDCCQAFGSSLGGRMLGSFGDIGAFSFSYYKPLSSLAGNGGMMAFSDSSIRTKLDRMMKLWRCDETLGLLDRKFHKISLTDAATAFVKFRYFRLIRESRANAMKIYRDALGGIEGVSFPSATDGSAPVMENFVILAGRRDELKKHLEKKGVQTDLPYTPMHSLGLFGGGRSGFPVTDDYHDRGLHLPLYSLMKADEVRRVTDAIAGFYA